jgi:hypothetical protein
MRVLSLVLAGLRSRYTFSSLDRPSILRLLPLATELPGLGLWL